MELNFYLEIAGLIIGIILLCATSIKNSIVDFKDCIYVNLVRIVTLMLGLNVVSYAIIHNNIFSLAAFSEIVISISFFMMVMFFTFINQYLYEIVHNRNSLTYKESIIIGFPLFMNLLLILENWGTHNVYDVVVVENEIQVVFNTWYKVPYFLAIISLLIYSVLMFVNKSNIKDKKLYVFYVIPFFMAIIYVLQYRWKATAILGFGYIIILLLLYIYSYSRLTKIDSLTNLPDGMVFKKMLDYRIGQKQDMIVAMVSLDDFKIVNREFGYHNGNRFLKKVAKYLKKKAPSQCLARYSGDKFAIVFDNRTITEVQDWCEEVLERFEKQWSVEERIHRLSVCISIIECPKLAKDSAEILELLEYMNTYGKQNKQNQYIICNDSFKEKMNRRRRITTILYEAIQNKKIKLKYQPILDIEKNIYNRAEAIVDLQDEELGDILPEEFYSIAEENGCITELGYLVLEKLCEYLNTIEDEHIIFSLNFSRQQLMGENVDKHIMQILNGYSIKPSRIAFEVSEETVSVQWNNVKEKMLKLQKLGFRFYLDGFGLGFLNISKLLELPFELIKINRSIISEAEKNDAIYLMLSAMIAVFEEHGKLVLGEGIDSEREKTLTDLLFVDCLQGEYLCGVLSEKDVLDAFRKENILEKMYEMEEVLEEE